jgi:hypothetical protein
MRSALTWTSGRSAPANLSALAMRFCRIWASSVGSARSAGRTPRLMVAPAFSMSVPSSSTTPSRIWPLSTWSPAEAGAQEAEQTVEDVLHAAAGAQDALEVVGVLGAQAGAQRLG